MSIQTIIGNTVSGWMSGNASQGDVVISSRVRLARNIEGYPFPTALSESTANEVINEVKAVIQAKENFQQFEFINLSDITPLERFVLVEKHLVSPQYVENSVGRGVAIDQDQSVSIMVNEEDHLRIQCFLPGLNFKEAWQCAAQVDDALEDHLDFAFSERVGYLTACPTNVGTGLRASAMVHLPALVMTNQANRVLGSLSQLGLALRGLYGEGSEAMGNLFQISNQVTLGKTEEDILANLSAVTRQIVDKEREARQALLQQAREQLEDRVWRAFGILANARLMSGSEAFSLLSDLRLGIDLRIITELPSETFNELIVITGKAYLQYLATQESNSDASDAQRARLIRSRIIKN